MLLPLVDAFIDEEIGKLYVISLEHGHSLAEWIEKSKKPWFLEDYEDNSRKELWELFSSLLNGIEALHNIKLIHRNLSPDTIYYSERSDYNFLKIGGITWSLYLHNLNYIPDHYKKRNLSYSIFKAPESYIVEQRSTTSGANPFANDIFSLGMTLCYIFNDNFPEYIATSLEEWEDQYAEITKYYNSSNHPLTDEESSFLLKCISKDPKFRPKTIIEAKREIQEIISHFDGEGIDLNEKLKVNWYNDPDSFFLRDLARYTSIVVGQVFDNPNQWLSEDFVNASIYATGLKNNSLILVTNNDVLFGLRPIFLKRKKKFNKDILEMYIIKTRQRSGVLRAIQDKLPVQILKNGLQYTSEFFRSDPLSRWRKILAIADREIKESREEQTEELEFIESMELMLEAEKSLDNDKILQYKKIKFIRRPIDRLENARVIVSYDLSRELTKQEKRDIYDKLDDYKRNNGGIIELSMANDPSSSWNHGREWRITKIQRTPLQISIERELKKKNKELDEEGVIRPFEMNISLSLYRRKERVIEDIKENDLILSAILDPKVTSFYLGLDTEGLEEPVSNIMNTIPMYLVQGPPGTGKTWTASTVVSNILKNDPYARILISSKDHEPLDHLVEAVVDKIPSEIEPRPIVVRAMSSEREQEYEASDAILKFKTMNQTINILKNAQKNIDSITILSHPLKYRWREIIDKNISNLSLKWMDEIQKVANIFFATSTSSTVQWLSKNAIPYDYIIVEEAAKSYPSELLLPMNLGHRWLLIGDQNQLPPFKYTALAETMSDLLDEEQVKRDEDDDVYYEFRQKSLTNIKLFEKLFNLFKETPVWFSEKKYYPCTQLNNQWRLPPLISDMISEIFYETKFNLKQTEPEERDPFSSPAFLVNNQIIWIDTPLGSDNREYLEKRTAGGSIINRGEIRLLIQLIHKLKLTDQSKRLENVDMVILSPYLAQKEELAKTFLSQPIPNIKPQKLRRICHTVDSFQGRQADIVIISLVRNNNQKSVRQALGFLTRAERLNVMFSRVKKRMIIIGCSKHILKFKREDESGIISQVFAYISRHGTIISVSKMEGDN
ncbi:MAG: AAA domain-containing protein [Candidatus Hermodarchaeota archaeon]